MAADLTNFEIKNNCVILLLVWFYKMIAGWCPFSAFYDFFIFQIILNIPRERRAGARSKLPDNEGYCFWSFYRMISISTIEFDKGISKQLRHKLLTWFPDFAVIKESEHECYRTFPRKIPKFNVSRKSFESVSTKIEQTCMILA